VQTDSSGADFLIRLIDRMKINSVFMQVNLFALLLNQPASSFHDSAKGQGFAPFLLRIPHLIPTDPAWRASVYSRISSACACSPSWSPAMLRLRWSIASSIATMRGGVLRLRGPLPGHQIRWRFERRVALRAVMSAQQRDIVTTILNAIAN
jgi:hypothetical protein